MHLMDGVQRSVRQYYFNDLTHGELRAYAAALHNVASDLEGKLDAEEAEKEQAEGRASDHAVSDAQALRDAQRLRDAAYADFVQRTCDAWKSASQRLRDAAARNEPDKYDSEAEFQRRKKQLTNAWKLPMTRRARANAIEALAEKWRGGA